MFTKIQNVWKLLSKMQATQAGEEKKKDWLPTPGFEPGPPGWKPGILTTRPSGRSDWHCTKHQCKLGLQDWCSHKVLIDPLVLQHKLVKGKKKDRLPTPGFEPGPPGWKPGILTTRPSGRSDRFSTKRQCKLGLQDWCSHTVLIDPLVLESYPSGI